MLKNLVPDTPSLKRKGAFVVEDTLGISLVTSAIYGRKKRNLAVVANDLYSAQKIYEFLLNFFKEEDVVFFPNDELLRAEALSSSKELMSQRVYAMGRLLEDSPKILVTHPSAILRYLPDPYSFRDASIHIKVGDMVDLAEFRKRLLGLGYSKVNKIDQSLQFANRGDILDVFSVSSLQPARIEFFGDEVESIRLFDLGTQVSGQSLEEIEILPATDLYCNEEDLAEWANRIGERLEKDAAELPEEAATQLKANVANDLENILSRNERPNLYRYFSLAHHSPWGILRYFDPELVLVANKEKFQESVDLITNEAASFYGEMRQELRIVSGLREYMDPLEAFGPIRPIYGLRFKTKTDQLEFHVRRIVTAGTGLTALGTTIKTYTDSCDKVVLCLAEQQQRFTAESILKELKLNFESVRGFNLPDGKIGISNEALSSGFEFPDQKVVFLSSDELFGHHTVATRYASRFKNATILRSYEDLKPGDYVVHEYNGIGQFLSVKTLEVEGAHRDYLHIAYAGSESLYVPLEQFRLVRKYSGREGARPKLSSLSRGDWTKKKEKIKTRINDLADRLIELYGTRLKIDGFAFPQDDELQERFEQEFPYSLTEDQAKCLAEIKADMESPTVMDRLLCGDVGFGKTEIAFRACFKTILAGRQAAILCPTTLLARQHFEVACERFREFGVKIALLSRLVSESEQKKAIHDIAEGKIDLIIGTHRLLSKEITFKQLGLLVVDEEQRFGVEQKERIKEISNSIDVLSLSATPIPRTLQMSLVGVRALSQINTPPSSRMPIQTYVAPYQEKAVRELISRELSRSGQVFYIHNRVDSIYRVAGKIAESIPFASVGVVHGQMDRETIEDIMEKFYDGRINVLVATSIIENGIDVPNANMIIVEDADRFGLSQLYQIKGRVGRGTRIAYAYLFYKQDKIMNEDAQKRLAAIQDFTELGSGFKIAQRDLMIRGAGDILGPEQAGFIDTVGLDLYLKMLNEALEERKTGVVPEAPKPNKMLSIDAFIPEDYAINSDKVALYQELADCVNDAEIDRFKKKLRDIYGKLPTEVELLIQKRRIDAMGAHSEFQSIDEFPKDIAIVLSDQWSSVNGIGVELFNELVPVLSHVKVSFYDKHLQLRVDKNGKWLTNLEAVMRAVRKLSMRHNIS